MDTIFELDVARFHEAFDTASTSLMDRVRNVLVESTDTAQITEEAVIGQLLMNELFPHPCNPQVGDYEGVFKGKLTAEQKTRLVKIADHMGPDWAQALYHVAVFLTKVA